MAKVKSGFNAASTKDHSTVKSTLSSIAGMTVLICVASFAKLNAEYNYLDKFLGNTNVTDSTPSAGRNLKALETYESISLP